MGRDIVGSALFFDQRASSFTKAHARRPTATRRRIDDLQTDAGVRGCRRVFGEVRNPRRFRDPVMNYFGIGVGSCVQALQPGRQLRPCEGVEIIFHARASRAC